MRVFVTGAGGFIGSQVCARLVARGHEVVASMYPGESRFRLAPVADAVRFVEADLSDSETVSALVEEVRPEGAAHLAWYAVPGEYWTSPENLGCVADSLHLARVLEQAGCVRLVVAGTCAEYDWSHADLVEDDTPCAPATLYGAAKLALFSVLRPFCAATKMRLAWARFHFLYGPGEAPGRLVSSLIEGLSAGQDVPCSEGQQQRDFLHVGDAGDAVAALLGSAVEGPVNIASGEAVPVRELVSRLAELIGGEGRPRFGALPPRDGDPERLAPSIARLRDEVGWTPSFDLRSGLEDTVRAWRESR